MPRGRQNAVQENGTSNAAVTEEQENAATDFKVNIDAFNPERGIRATASVVINDICTIRNVKIKEDDYGINVVMPRTKMPETNEYKDSCFFQTKELLSQFEQAVETAYQEAMNMYQGEAETEEFQEDMEEEMDEEENMRMGM